MWIPKTEEEVKELARDREISARTLGVFSAFCIFVIMIFMAKYVGFKDQFGQIGQTYTLNQISHNFPKFGISSLIFGVVMYFVMRKYRQISSLVCEKCGKIKRYDKVENCDCGGHFVFIDEMKWIEEEETDNNEDKKENT